MTMSGLLIYHFRFTTEVTSPIELEEHCGSALRGNLFESVWSRFCTNRTAPTCAECPLHTHCPVSALVAPLREEHPRGRDIPRPYSILPPLDGAKYYEPGAQFRFGLTLFGSIVQLLPYLMLSLQTIEAVGLGHRVERNNGRRGRFTIKQIEACNPLNEKREIIYEAGKAKVEATMLSISAKEVQERAASLSNERITLHFLTPTRITYQERPLDHAVFHPIIHRLLERISALQVEYGGDERRSMDERLDDLKLAEQVQCVEDGTRWEEVSSHSRRTRRNTSISGIIGRATFAGNLDPFRELLVWGELAHVGKNCVKGNGRYRIEA